MCNGGGERTRTGQEQGRGKPRPYYTRSTGSFPSYGGGAHRAPQVDTVVSTTIYCAAAADSRAVVASGVAFPMVRVALVKARMNNQAVTTATPAREIHIIHRATVTFVSLVRLVTNQDR